MKSAELPIGKWLKSAEVYFLGLRNLFNFDVIYVERYSSLKDLLFVVLKLNFEKCK